jgi:hypothetical protein
MEKRKKNIWKPAILKSEILTKKNVLILLFCIFETIFYRKKSCVLLYTEGDVCIIVMYSCQFFLIFHIKMYDSHIIIVVYVFEYFFFEAKCFAKSFCTVET